MFPCYSGLLEYYQRTCSVRTRFVATLYCALFTQAALSQDPGPADEAGRRFSPPVATPIKSIYFPVGVNSSAEFEERRAAQLATRNAFGVFHEFTFTDTQPQSGISFLHRFVDDAGKDYKAAHYDHGNGIAVADVDLDGLFDVYLISQAGSSGLYRNLGDGTFEGITARAGVANADAIGVTANFADFDNDGDPDLYVTNVRSPNKLFENDGQGGFTDIAQGAGLAYNEHSSAALFFDYDRDGLLDVFVAVVGEYTSDATLKVTGTPDAENSVGTAPNYFVAHRDAFGGHLIPHRQRASRVFHNDGNSRFTDVTEALGLVDESWTGDATPTDFNLDG